MSSLNIAYDLSVHIGIEPNAHAAGAILGVGIATADFDEALIILHMGVVGTSIALKAQDSDAVGGTYADITGATFGTIAAAADQAIHKGRIKLHDVNAFLRCHLTVTTSAADVSAAILLFRGGKGPYGTLTFNV